MAVQPCMRICFKTPAGEIWSKNEDTPAVWNPNDSVEVQGLFAAVAQGHPYIVDQGEGETTIIPPTMLQQSIITVVKGTYLKKEMKDVTKLPT